MSNDKRLSNLQNTLTTVAGVVEQLANKLKDLNSQISQLAGNSSKLGKAQEKVAKETQKAAKETEKQANATEKANKANKGFFGNLGKNIKTIVSFYGAYQVLNLAVQAFSELTVGSAKRAIAFEKALSDLRAIANLSAADIQRLEKVVFEVAGSTSLTTLEVVELQKQLAKLGSSVSDIENLTGPIAILSQSLGEEPGGVAAALKKTINQFQSTSEEANTFANVMVGAVNETALSLNDLGTSLSYVGPLASQLGVSFEETAALLGILADNGFKASKAGTGLRQFFITAAKDGRPFNEFLQDISAGNLNISEATELFNKTGASQALVISENLEKFERLKLELSDTTRLMKANAAQMDNAQGQLDLLASAYDKFSTKLGNIFIQNKTVIGITQLLDVKTAALAETYGILANATEKTDKSIKSLINSFRTISEESEGFEFTSVEKALEIIDSSGQFGEYSLFLFQQYLDIYQKLGKTEQEALNAIEDNQGRAVRRIAATANELIDQSRERAVELDNEAIAIKANDDVVKSYSKSITNLQSLAAKDIDVFNKKVDLYQDLEEEIRKNEDAQEDLRKKGLEATTEDVVSGRVTEKRIALLKDLIKQLRGVTNGEDELARVRKKSNNDYFEEIDLLLGVEKDLIINQKQSRQFNALLGKLFAENAVTISGLTDELGKLTDGTEEFNRKMAEIEDLEGLQEAIKKYELSEKDIEGIVKKLYDHILLAASRENLDGLTEILNEAFDKELSRLTFGEDGTVTTEAIETEIPLRPIFKPEGTGDDAYGFVDQLKDQSLKSFQELALYLQENGTELVNTAYQDIAAERLATLQRELDAELDLIDNRYEVEQDILKSQLDNQLITESQFRQKQKELRKAQVAEENAIERQRFNAEKKQDLNNAKSEYLAAIAQAFINEVVAGVPFPFNVSNALITSAGAGAAFGSQVAAISQRKYVDKKFAEGGLVNGPSHSEGGVPFTVQGRGNYEMEGGEYIVNKRATAMHKDLLERINKSGMTRPQAGRYKFAEGGLVSSPLNESVDYLKAIAEATTSTAIGVSKPVRAYVADKDLRGNATERRIRDRNDRI
jgi:hypothetical protein